MSLRLCVIAAAANAASAAGAPAADPAGLGLLQQHVDPAVLAQMAQHIDPAHLAQMAQHMDPAVLAALQKQLGAPAAAAPAASADSEEPLSSLDPTLQMLANALAESEYANLVSAIPYTAEMAADFGALQLELMNLGLSAASGAAEVNAALERVLPKLVHLAARHLPKEVLVALRNSVTDIENLAAGSLASHMGPQERYLFGLGMKTVNWDKLIECSEHAGDSEKLAELTKEVFDKEKILEVFEIVRAMQEGDEQLPEQESDEELPPQV